MDIHEFTIIDQAEGEEEAIVFQTTELGFLGSANTSAETVCLSGREFGSLRR